MNNILQQIYEHKLIEVRNSKKKLAVSQICDRINCGNYQEFNFFKALENKVKNNKIGLIAEIKKASPSNGIIRQNFNHIEIAKDYASAGATCLSILTDNKYFMGSDQYLQEVRAISQLPILRKDFIIDSYQIYEAKMLGANCILLIVAMLDDNKLKELEQCALDAGLSVLIEVHNEQELQRASKLKSKLIGINNRNLKTLEVNINTAQKLASQVPSDYLLIGESGIKSPSDLKLLQEAGINCFLIGEYFMRQNNIAKAVENLLGN